MTVSCALLMLVGCSSTPRGDGILYVGAAKVDVTPPVETFEDTNGNGSYDAGEPFTDLNGNGKWDPVWLAGFKQARAAFSVHDPLWARAILFEKDGRRAVVIACDVVGFLHPRVRRLRERIEGVDQVIFASTHCHSAPDTVGLWGPFPGISGLSEPYLRQFEDGVLECVRKAIAARVPATLAAGRRCRRGADIRSPTSGTRRRCRWSRATAAAGRSPSSSIRHASGGWGRRTAPYQRLRVHYVRGPSSRTSGAVAASSAAISAGSDADVKDRVGDPAVRRTTPRGRIPLQGRPEVAVPSEIQSLQVEFRCATRIS
jgi:hypothetical protein